MAGIIYYDYSQAEPMRMAAQILKEDEGQLYSCPRFFYPSEEGVAEIRNLLSKLDSADEREKVIYFTDADLLNVSCQNALLKTLEDRDDVICIFVASKRLLDTIESRCQIFRCQIPSREVFYKELGGIAAGMPWLYSFSGGHTDVAGAVVKDATLCNIMNRLYLYGGPGTVAKEDIFKLFNMLKEKDTDCFFEKYKEYVPNTYALLTSVLFKAVIGARPKRRWELEKLLDVLTVHQRRVRASKSYSKNDFFDLIARM